MKVLFLNNYPMDEAFRLWQRGVYPGQHLFGTNLLGQHGCEVEILPWRVHPWLASLGARARLGDLDHQFRALSTRCDVVFAACQFETLALAMLRSAGLFGRPLVPIVHGPFRPGLEVAIGRGPYAKGHDHLICFGEPVARHMREAIGVPASKLDVLCWGVDLGFYRKDLVAPPPEGGVPLILTAGKTGREYAALMQAVEGLPCRLRVVTSGVGAPPPGRVPPNVEITAGPGNDFALAYPELLALYGQARAVVVPLRPVALPRSQVGITSLFEAMALGRATLMTRSPYLAVDVEAEGVGLWVDDTPEDWRRAIRRMLDAPEEARRMGERGRALCEERYHMDLYAAELASILRKVAK